MSETDFKNRDKITRLKERLQLRDVKLKTLLELTQAINDNLSTKELLSQYQNIVEKDLLIKKLVLFTKTDGIWANAISYGHNSFMKWEDVAMDCANVKGVELIRAGNNKALDGFDMLIPVFHKEMPQAYLCIGDTDEDELAVSPIIKHMRFIQTLTNLISVAIENKTLMEKSLEQERIKTELDLAAEMQALMVDSGHEVYDGYEVATYYRPHQQVGGDFYDFIPLNDNEAFFCVADVSGKGVSAAFLMANVQAHMKATLQYTDWTLESLAIELNRKVIETVKGDRFVTFFLGHYDGASRTLTYLNAGHNPPVVLNEGEISLLECGTVGIGMLDELPFIKIGQMKLAPGAVLVAYTDGVVEIENEHQEEYGHDKLGNLLKNKVPDIQHIDDLIAQIIHSIDIHRGKNPYFDDTALLCIRFR
jgi:sigma-B regulation protein RsbU (phosphoserine phosphatase)